MELSTFLVSEASTMATNYNNAHMKHCNRANFQVTDSREVFLRQTACVVSAYSYNVVVIELQLVIAFCLSQARQLQTIPMPTVYGDCKPVFFAQILSQRWLRKVSCSDEARDNTPHGDASVHVSATWKFVQF